jgi:hypothetical protein
MRIKEIEVYKFNELPRDIQEEVIDRFRYYEVEDIDWWEYALDEFKDRVQKEYGVEIGDDFNYSLDRDYYIVFNDVHIDKKIFLKALYQEGNLSKRAYNKLTNRTNIDEFELAIGSSRYSNFISVHDYSDEKNGRYITDYLYDEIDLDNWFYDVISKPALKELEETYDYLISNEVVNAHHIFSRHNKNSRYDEC